MMSPVLKTQDMPYARVKILLSKVQPCLDFLLLMLEVPGRRTSFMNHTLPNVDMCYKPWLACCLR